MNGKIGIMGAMPEEIDLLLPQMEHRANQVVGQRTFTSGILANKEVVVVYSRMGKVAASSTATTLINIFDCQMILFTGVAGALSKDLNIGDMIVSSSLVQHDMDVSALPGFRKFEVPLLDKQFFSPPLWLADKALSASEKYLREVMPADIDNSTLKKFGITSPKSMKGLIASGDQFIASKEETLNLLKDLPDILCVEMEGAAVAQVAEEYGVPYIVTRTISDKADHSAHIDFPLFVKEVATNLTCGVLTELLKRL